MRKIETVWPLLVLTTIWVLPEQSFGKNLHLIDQLPNGFKIYRSGSPTTKDLKEFHNLGIEEIAVLSGDARKHEIRHAHLVPRLKVIYNERQDEDDPLTTSFLRWFDTWVAEARREGKIIAIRCRCGCHRTGRLAAYYQMKYQNLCVEDALAFMNEYGRNMFLHPELEPQVRALEDHIRGRSCSQDEKYCIVDDSSREKNRTEPLPPIRR